MRKLPFAVLIICAAAPRAALSEEPQAADLCIYANKTYSEGALICIAKDRANHCNRNDKGKLLWQVVLPNDGPSRIQAGVCAGPPS